MSFSLVVSITDGDLSDLDLTPANGYYNPRGGLGPGARVWARQTAESPFVDGRILVGRRLEMATAPLAVLVAGTTSSELMTRLGALIDRLEQPSYVLQVVADGVTFRWQCECADNGPGDAGIFDVPDMVMHRQAWRFSIPRQPAPIAGIV